jgi:hypothetical protein
VGVLTRCAAVKRPPGPIERHAGACEPVGKHIVGERNDLVSAGMNIAVHVADEMANPRSFGEVARIYHEYVFVRRRDDVGRLRVVMEKLSWMKNRPGRKFEREYDTIGRFDEPPHAAAIDGAHRQFDYGEPGRWLGVWMKYSHGNRSRGKRHVKGKR